MWEIFQYSFMLRAFAAGIIISFIAPVIGSFLVVKRFSLVADTLSHIALAGVGISLLTNTQPVLVTVAITILAAVVIEKIRTSRNLPGEVILAMFLPGGLALSVILISLANGINTNLFSYLFGSITTVSNQDIAIISVLGVLTAGVVMWLYRPLLFTVFDEESAKVNGVKTEQMNLILLILTAITVSLAMRVVGILLIGALMVIPVTTAMQISRTFKQSIFLSIIFALVSVIAGLFISYFFGLPAGGVIVLLSLGVFGMTSLVKFLI